MKIFKNAKINLFYLICLALAANLYGNSRTWSFISGFIIGGCLMLLILLSLGKKKLSQAEENINKIITDHKSF